tara:strand:+ start:154 stop:585 length:432 start_codon:yes stop_codon:yes gene_type:complete
MALVDSTGNPIQPKLDQNQMMQLMTGLRIRIDAANAQLVQLGLLVEYLYENLSEQGISIEMEDFPKWAESRYAEIQQQAKEAMEQSKEEVDKIKDSLKEELANATDTIKESMQQAQAQAETATSTTTKKSTARKTKAKAKKSS